MGTAVEYQKVITETVFINLPGPEEPSLEMTGGELLHGFLADLDPTHEPDVKDFINSLCAKWNVHYRNNGS